MMPGGASGPAVPASQQEVPEPRKYTGGNIPSRSFRVLQQMTADDQALRRLGVPACSDAGWRRRRRAWLLRGDTSTCNATAAARSSVKTPGRSRLARLLSGCDEDKEGVGSRGEGVADSGRSSRERGDGGVKDTVGADGKGTDWELERGVGVECSRSDRRRDSGSGSRDSYDRRDSGRGSACRTSRDSRGCSGSEGDRSEERTGGNKGADVSFREDASSGRGVRMSSINSIGSVSSFSSGFGDAEELGSEPETTGDEGETLREGDDDLESRKRLRTLGDGSNDGGRGPGIGGPESGDVDVERKRKFGKGRDLDSDGPWGSEKFTDRRAKGKGGGCEEQLMMSNEAESKRVESEGDATTEEGDQSDATSDESDSDSESSSSSEDSCSDEDEVEDDAESVTEDAKEKEEDEEDEFEACLAESETDVSSGKEEDEEDSTLASEEDEKEASDGDTAGDGATLVCSRSATPEVSASGPACRNQQEGAPSLTGGQGQLKANDDPSLEHEEVSSKGRVREEKQEQNEEMELTQEQNQDHDEQEQDLEAIVAEIWGSRKEFNAGENDGEVLFSEKREQEFDDWLARLESRNARLKALAARPPVEQESEATASLSSNDRSRSSNSKVKRLEETDSKDPDVKREEEEVSRDLGMKQEDNVSENLEVNREDETVSRNIDVKRKENRDSTHSDGEDQEEQQESPKDLGKNREEYGFLNTDRREEKGYDAEKEGNRICGEVRGRSEDESGVQDAIVSRVVDDVLNLACQSLTSKDEIRHDKDIVRGRKERDKNRKENSEIPGDLGPRPHSTNSTNGDAFPKNAKGKIAVHISVESKGVQADALVHNVRNAAASHALLSTAPNKRRVPHVIITTPDNELNIDVLLGSPEADNEMHTSGPYESWGECYSKIFHPTLQRNCPRPESGTNKHCTGVNDASAVVKDSLSEVKDFVAKVKASPFYVMGEPLGDPSHASVKDSFSSNPESRKGHVTFQSALRFFREQTE